MLTTFINRGRQIQIGRAPKGGIELAGKFHRGGQFMPVAALPIAGGAPEDEAQPKPAGYRIYSGGRPQDRLNRRSYYRCGGDSGAWASRWWIRNDKGGFETVPPVRGDDRFDETLDLTPGDYVLGTGWADDEIRRPFRITPDGELVYPKDGGFDLRVPGGVPATLAIRPRVYYSIRHAKGVTEGYGAEIVQVLEVAGYRAKVTVEMEDDAR